MFSLVFFHADRWLSLVNVPRAALDGAAAGMRPAHGALTPTLRFMATAVLCDSVELQPYRDNWAHGPELRPHAGERGDRVKQASRAVCA